MINKLTPRSAHTDERTRRVGTVSIQGVVSVVIPCFAQAQFLGAAIESVLAQTYQSVEILVIDDGSPDNTSDIASKYIAVRYVRQKNQGRSAARNVGLRLSRGEFLVFLDADDRLRSNALELGVALLAAHRDWAFVSGRCIPISQDGSILPLADDRESTEADWPIPDCYRDLLLNNYIATPGAVIFRRNTMMAVGGFDTSLHASEDYDLYLRVARCCPVGRHGEIVVEKRRHATNTTNDALRTLPAALRVIRSQRTYVRGNRAYEEAWQTGLRDYIEKYGFGVAYAAAVNARRGELKKLAFAVRLMSTRPSYMWYGLKRLMSWIHDRRPGAAQHVS